VVSARWSSPVGASPAANWPAKMFRSESSSAPSRAKTPDHRARAKTPSTPDTIRSRAKTPEGMRPRSAWTELGDKEENVEQKRAASATPASQLKKPKVFCEDDFKKFLARQDQHKAAHARHLVIPNGLIAGLRPTPLLPIMNGNGFVMQGSIYVEADWRSKPQQGHRPDPSLQRVACFCACRGPRSAELSVLVRWKTCARCSDADSRTCTTQRN
jgi:hypothetical protein